MSAPTADPMPSDLALFRFWNKLARTEPPNPEDYIGWADDRYGPHRGYLLAYRRWVANRPEFADL